MCAYIIKDFLRINPSKLSGSKAEEDPNGLTDEVSKTLAIMGLTSSEKAELATYQLKDVFQVLYEKWKDSRQVEAVPIEWEIFNSTFLERFFPTELTEAKFGEFINLKQNKMSVKEYALEFTQLSNYSPILVANPNKFVTGVSEFSGRRVSYDNACR
ncbi:uncharacterized protein [Solanum lycopersicum]|uniref:uncharacterized protein n=1 Tax=Solanum lycopersicum TaxID=4081 RepID=UPI0002BC9FF3|nr:uncharacterized protein LOC101265152 [Solanum lycopersicum]